MSARPEGVNDRQLSVVVPVCNEAENVEPLAREIDAALAQVPYEMIFIDDGSTDDTAKILASEIKPLSSLNETLSREVVVLLKTPSRTMFGSVAEVLLRHRGDRRVRFDLEVRDLPRPMRVRAELATVQVRPSEQLVADLERLCGVGTVKLR